MFLCQLSPPRLHLLELTTTLHIDDNAPLEDGSEDSGPARVRGHVCRRAPARQRRRPASAGPPPPRGTRCSTGRRSRTVVGRVLRS